MSDCYLYQCKHVCVPSSTSGVYSKPLSVEVVTDKVCPYCRSYQVEPDFSLAKQLEGLTWLEREMEGM